MKSFSVGLLEKLKGCISSLLPDFMVANMYCPGLYVNSAGLGNLKLATSLVRGMISFTKVSNFITTQLVSKQ